MQINKLKFRLIALVLFLGFFNLNLRAQATDALGAYSPYSLFGVGEIVRPGGAFNMSMGGIGIGVRDNRFINYLNPAASCARDTLAFMLDFGIVEKNTYNKDANTTSAYNVFNMNNIALSFPIYKKSAFIVGVAPFSNTGYKFETTETNPDLIADMGNVKYQKFGTGSINQLFFGASMVFLKYFSIGAEGIYYFGNLDRKSNVLFTSYGANRDILTGWNYKINSFSGRFGLQYSQPFKNNQSLTVGLTYRLGSNIKGDAIRYAFTDTSIKTDTIYYNNDQANIKIASEMGIGFSYRKKDKWMVGFDYVRQNWENSKLDTKIFKAQTSNTFKIGGEYIPRRYDSRYYLKRVAYRAGAYYEQSYMSINGYKINSFGITLGASLPIYKWYNAVSVAIDMGQRGSISDFTVRERYVNFIININLHDVWFVKYRYD